MRVKTTCHDEFGVTHQRCLSCSVVYVCSALCVCVCQLRDEKGMRDDLDNRLTALKRSELAGVMAGRKLPQPLAAMMFR